LDLLWRFSPPSTSTAEGDTMTVIWKDEYFPHSGLIKIVGSEKYWNVPIYYVTIQQACQKNDPNPRGTVYTRGVAKCLFSSHLVNLVKFSGETITISVIDDTTQQEVFILSQTVIDILDKCQLQP